MQSNVIRTFFAILITALLTSNAVAATPQNFTPCADANTQPALAGSLCLSVALPFHHDQADDQRSAQVFVRKFPAVKSKGAVWLIAGGPGESGASFYPHLKTLQRAFKGFDLLVPDHRGTGFSTRLCPTEEALASLGGTSLVGEEWGSCIGSLWAKPQDLFAFGITQAAHDLDFLIQTHSSKGKVFVYGVSYGTQLVLRTMSLTKNKISGLVLDSLVPVQTDTRFDLSQRSQVVDEVGRKVLKLCDAEPSCDANLNESSERSLQLLYAQLAAAPLTIEGQRFDDLALKEFLGHMLDIPEARKKIRELILDLEAGRTEKYRDILKILQSPLVSNYPQSPVAIPLVLVISGSENNLQAKLSADEIKAEQSQLLFTSPLPALLAQNSMPRYERDAYFGQEPQFLPPALVLQGTLDPKTPYEAAREHVSKFAGKSAISFIAVEHAPHFILGFAPKKFETEVGKFVRNRPHSISR